MDRPPSGYPMPTEEALIERSPINGPIVVTPGGPQWIELAYIIADYNPEWVSIDIWGENIQILEFGASPPADSPLLECWDWASQEVSLFMNACLNH